MREEQGPAGGSRIKRIIGSFGGVLALALIVGAAASRASIAQSSAPACDARLALAHMRSATGGNNWDRIAETSAFGDATMAGLRGRARFDDDLMRGRFARRFWIEVMGASAEVYDGKMLWAQDISGGVRPYDSPYARQQSLTNAYLARRGYFAPEPGATFSCGESKGEGGRSEWVIHVQPHGGSPAELAIDAETNLLASISQRTPLETSVVTYADYRTIEGVVLPFSISSGTKSNPSDDYKVVVSRYVLRRDARHGDFSKPIPPSDARMVGNAVSTTVPMMLEGRQLIVWASINGRSALPFILDTGGHAILTTQAAHTLGVRASGAGESGGSGAGTISTAYARINSIRIGAAELLDQPVLVIPYPYSFYERGKKTPLAGIIGLEFFERYAARLDYGDRTVTFTPLSTFRYRGDGVAVPFTFETDPDLPMVNAAADEHEGLFGVDTGNAGNLILFGDFLKDTGLLTRYAAGASIVGQGTGGSNAGYLETLREFTIGDRSLRDIATTFTQMQRGSFSAWTQAGNLGFSILSRFIPTLDYASQTLYLDPEKRETPLEKNRSGMGFEKNSPDAFDVLVVKPGSAAAAAGIAVGDRILAINGTAASNYSWADLVRIVAAPPGTNVRLRVAHGSAIGDLVIVLR
jgi:PDZ domain/Aspartyl protease